MYDQPMAVVKPKVSVWLSQEKNNELKRFHCLNCGKVIFEYYNDVKVIMQGEMGEVKESPIVIQCNGLLNYKKNGDVYQARCKSKYSIE